MGNNKKPKLAWRLVIIFFLCFTVYSSQHLAAHWSDPEIWQARPADNFFKFFLRLIGIENPFNHAFGKNFFFIQDDLSTNRTFSQNTRTRLLNNKQIPGSTSIGSVNQGNTSNGGDEISILNNSSSTINTNSLDADHTQSLNEIADQVVIDTTDTNMDNSNTNSAQNSQDNATDSSLNEALDNSLTNQMDSNTTLINSPETSANNKINTAIGNPNSPVSDTNSPGSNNTTINLPTINPIPSDDQAAQRIDQQNQLLNTTARLIASRQALVKPVVQEAQSSKYQAINADNIPPVSTDQPPADVQTKARLKEITFH